MQSFKDIPSNETLTDSRQDILNNDHTLMSNSAGTAFPTTNLEVGMECYRTDLSQLFMLKDLAPTWIMVDDLTKVPAYQDWVNSQLTSALANKLDISEAVTSAQPNKLLRMNASGYLATSITGNAASANTANTATTAYNIPTSDVGGNIWIA